MSEEMIRRVVRSEIKSVNADDFSVDVVMSDETVDRYREVIKASAWKKGLANYKAHPVLLSSHNYHGLMNQIGEASYVGIRDGALRTKFKYYVKEEVPNPEAAWGWVLASKGVAAYSVGFIRKAGFYVDEDEPCPQGVDEEEYKEYLKKGVRYVYTDVELLECSHVLVPANPSALQNSFDTGMVMRSLEEKAFPMLAELEEELKKLGLTAPVKDVTPAEEETEDDPPAPSTKSDEEDSTMKLEDVEKMAEAIRASLLKDEEERMQKYITALIEALKSVSEEMTKRMLDMVDAELAKRKEQEVKEVVGEVKADELQKDTDGILDLFKSITTEVEQTFKD